MAGWTGRCCMVVALAGGAVLAVAAAAAPGRSTMTMAETMPGALASGVFSPLPAAWEAHRAEPLQRVGPLQIPLRRAAAPGPPLVLGWLPYWMVSNPTLHMDLLTHVAYFGVQVGTGGELVNPRHWTNGELAPLILAAHEAGVGVVLTVICFDSKVIEAVLGDPLIRTRLVARVTDMVVEGGGDGVNVDFEGLPLSSKADFVTFVADLKASLDAALGQSHVSVATPAVDWKGAYDYDELSWASDALVIMGYEYHYSGGSPGPISPLAPSDRWGRYSLAWTLDDYDRYAGVQNRGRIALALPLYGHDWPTVDGSVPGVATGKAASPSFAQCAEGGVRWGWRFDTASTTPWYYIPGESRQVWCEDRASLAAKISLAFDRGLAGVGFWALGYEGRLDAPWEALAEAWPAAARTGDQAPDVGEETGPVDGAFSEETVTDDRSDSGLWADRAELQRGDVAAQDRVATDVITLDDSPAGEDSRGPPARGGCVAGSRPVGPWWVLSFIVLLTACVRRRGAGRMVL